MVILFMLALAIVGFALPTSASTLVFPTEKDWWVIGAQNTLVFDWTLKGGVPVTSLYNTDSSLMQAPFFWESNFYVHGGLNVVNSSTALVGAKPGPGYYITIDVQGKHLTSNTFEIKAEGSPLAPVPASGLKTSSAPAQRDVMAARTLGLVTIASSVALAVL